MFIQCFLQMVLLRATGMSSFEVICTDSTPFEILVIFDSPLTDCKEFCFLSFLPIFSEVDSDGCPSIEQPVQEHLAGFDFLWSPASKGQAQQDRTISAASEQHICSSKMQLFFNDDDVVWLCFRLQSCHELPMSGCQRASSQKNC